MCCLFVKAPKELAREGPSHNRGERHLRSVSATAEVQRVLGTDRQDQPRHDASAGSVEEWFLVFETELGKYLVQIVRDRSLAEDLLQETFCDAYRARHTLTDVRNPRAWLFGIARHRALAALRSRRRLSSAIARLVARRDETGSLDGGALSVLDLLEQQLTPEDRALVLLRYLYGFDANELAEMTGRSSAAVRQRLSRARTKMLRSGDSLARRSPDERK